MQHARRTLLGAVGAGMAMTAGCSGLLEDVTTHEAAAASVSAEALNETGFTHEGSDTLEEEREFAGQTVSVTNTVSEYRRTVGVEGVAAAETAIFALLTSPQVTVAGQDFNPLADMNNRDIASLVQDHYEEFSIGDQLGERSVETLETTITVETFRGTATVTDGEEAQVRLDVGNAEHEGDHVVFMGVYPASQEAFLSYDPSAESDRIATLIAGAQHPAEGD